MGEMKDKINQAIKNQTLTGKVKWFDIKKGYGFIEDKNGKQYFVHHSGITKGRIYTGLDKGAEVSFNVTGENENGPICSNVVMGDVPVTKEEKIPANNRQKQTKLINNKPSNQNKPTKPLNNKTTKNTKPVSQKKTVKKK